MFLLLTLNIYFTPFSKVSTVEFELGTSPKTNTGKSTFQRLHPKYKYLITIEQLQATIFEHTFSCCIGLPS